MCAGLFAKADTYTYNFWDDIENSPDAYRVSHVLYANDLGLDKPLKNPTSLFADGNTIYLVDTDNNRIIVLEYTQKKTLELVKVIDRVNDSLLVGDNTALNAPQDIFVSESGHLFIADTQNGRVLRTASAHGGISTTYRRANCPKRRGRPQRRTACCRTTPCLSPSA